MSKFFSPLLLFLVSLVSLACNHDAPVTDVTTETAEIVDSLAFGAVFAAEDALPATALTAQYDEHHLRDTVAVTLRGKVNDVCQKRGCWMTVAAGGEQEIMVKFKDYGFFVPFDLGGQEVAMEGVAFYEVTPVEELRHYAEDAGESPEKIAMITEPRRELKFLANGVQILP